MNCACLSADGRSPCEALATREDGLCDPCRAERSSPTWEADRAFWAAYRPGALGRALARWKERA